jgi:hypothetical protein
MTTEFRAESNTGSLADLDEQQQLVLDALEAAEALTALELASDARLSVGEVKAAVEGLTEVGFVRQLDPVEGVCRYAVDRDALKAALK